MSDFMKTMLEIQRKIEPPVFDSTGQAGQRRYGYASLGACLKAIVPVCNEQGVSVWFENCPEEDGSTVYTVVCTGEEQRMLFPVHVPANSDMQRLGSALTYAKRYSLCGAFAIAAEEDDDGNRAQTPKEERKSGKVPDDGINQEVLLNVAKARLWKAAQDYGREHGRTGEEIMEGVKKRPEWAETADFFNTVAAEFESELEQ